MIMETILISKLNLTCETYSLLDFKQIYLAPDWIV